MARSFAVFEESAIYSANSSNMETPLKAIRKVKGKFHTPICRDNCDLTHHELVLAIFMDARCADGRVPHSGDLPAALKRCIESAKLSGWDQNSDIPDPSEELRCPLLFLACAFGKIGILKALLRNNFDPLVVNQHGETALHYTAQHLWAYYAEPCRSAAKKATTIVIECFEQIVNVLTNCDPKILAMKDDSGRTFLHVLTSTSVINSHSHRASHFHQLYMCLKSVIRRLLKLLDASVFTRSEVIEIITTAESTNGDSVLHVLARDHVNGFRVLQFLQTWLFVGKLPDIKNRENKTVFEIAWETNPQDTKEWFSSMNPLVYSHQQIQYERSTQMMQFEGTLISNNGHMSTAPINVGFIEPQTHHSSNLDTGNPSPQCTFPEIQKEGDLPYITQVFSLCSEESLESDSTSDLNSMVEGAYMPSNVEIVESYAEVNASSPRSGLNGRHINYSFGFDAIGLVRQNVVDVALMQYSDKLSELEETLPKLDQIIDEAKVVIDQKMARVSMLEKELDLVKRGALAKMKCIEELQWKKELLREETKRLKRKVEFCREKQNQFVNHCKKGESA